MCISLTCHGQTRLDSLKSLVAEARLNNRPKNEAYQLYWIGFHFYQQNQHDSAVHYYKQVLNRSADDAVRASALNGIGMTYSVMGFPDLSIPYYNEAILLFEAQKDTVHAVTASYNLAIIYKDKGLYDNALEISFNNLAKLERQKPDRALASSYNTIGTVYSRIQDYQKAYEYYRKALQIRLSLKYEQGIGQSYNNLGELFGLMGQYDSAIANLEKARSIRQKINDTRGLGRTLSMVGNTLLQWNKPREAKERLTQALAINRSSDDNLAATSTLNSLAAVNIALKEFALADENLSAANDLIEKTHTRADLQKNLQLRADLYRGTGDKTKLITTLERLQVVKDSILNSEKIENLLTLEIQYETEKKEQEIVVLQQQRLIDQGKLEQNRTLIAFLILAVAMTIVIAVLIFRLYRLTQKGKRTAELNTKELHHRTTNNLQMLISFFTVQGSAVSDLKAAEVLKSTEGRVNAMVLIHKKLYKNEQSTSLDLKNYVSELIEYLVFAYGFDQRLKTDLVVDSINIVADKAIAVGLILNELISNSLKYGYGGQSEPLLKLHIRNKAETLWILLRDNGTTPFSFHNSEGNSSFGLRMVRSLVRERNGTIESNYDKGTEYQITIPI
jgi:two-component sensor histidine kinase